MALSTTLRPRTLVQHSKLMGPAFVAAVQAPVLLGVGLDPTRLLILSQVVLSFGIPFALVPLDLLARDRGPMALIVR